MSNKHRIIDSITTPSDISVLSDSELNILCNEIREEIIDVTSKNGGHVSASLGCVETIVSVHSLINSPKDKFIFDVGHQAYAHKLLTGRLKNFPTIRTLNGISGFTNPYESEHDVTISGHASDSLSIALGLAIAKEQRGSDEKIVALIGDASIAGGMAFEALNQIGKEKLPLVIIFNENSMSISPNVGALTDHLQNIRVDSKYVDARDAIYYGLKRFGSVGELAIKWTRASKESLKHFLFPSSMIFEDLGITCTAPIDGHDISKLRKTLTAALNYDEPIIVHVVTHKGYGYAPAYKDPELFHGIGPYNINTGIPIKSKTPTFTSVFGEAIVDEASVNDKIFALTAAMSGGTGLKNFAKAYPDRFVDVGIAEQHLLGVSSGLANGGYKPVVAIYSAFLQRAYDQLITNIAMPNLDAVICIDRAGLVGADGYTHHGIFDISFCKNVPNLTVIAPSCAYELKCALHTAITDKGPYVIRYPRGSASEIDDCGSILETPIDDDPLVFDRGSSRILKKGSDVAILAFGECVVDALRAHKYLSDDNLSAFIVDMRYIKPLDESLIEFIVKKTNNIITVENGVINGGVGESVLLLINKLGIGNRIKFRALGINDEFVAHGSVEELKSIQKFDARSIYKCAKDMV